MEDHWVRSFEESLWTGDADVAVRFGPADGRSLIVRKLFDTHVLNCAASAYLDRYGTPQISHDLRRLRMARPAWLKADSFDGDWQWLVNFTSPHQGDRWAVDHFSPIARGLLASGADRNSCPSCMIWWSASSFRPCCLKRQCKHRYPKPSAFYDRNGPRHRHRLIPMNDR